MSYEKGRAANSGQGRRLLDHDSTFANVMVWLAPIALGWLLLWLVASVMTALGVG